MPSVPTAYGCAGSCSHVEARSASADFYGEDSSTMQRKGDGSAVLKFACDWGMNPSHHRCKYPEGCRRKLEAAVAGWIHGEEGKAHILRTHSTDTSLACEEPCEIALKAPIAGQGQPPRQSARTKRRQSKGTTASAGFRV